MNYQSKSMYGRVIDLSYYHIIEKKIVHRPVPLFEAISLTRDCVLLGSFYRALPSPDILDKVLDICSTKDISEMTDVELYEKQYDETMRLYLTMLLFTDDDEIKEMIKTRNFSDISKLQKFKNPRLVDLNCSLNTIIENEYVFNDYGKDNSEFMDHLIGTRFDKKWIVNGDMLFEMRLELPNIEVIGDVTYLAEMNDLTKAPINFNILEKFKA